MAVISADFGGTRIKLGIVQESKLLASAKLTAQPNKSTKENLDELSQVVQLLLKENEISRSELTGIGLSFPSIVDSDANQVLSKYVKYTDADKFDFNRWSKEEWQL